MHESTTLVQKIIKLPIFEAEWVLWLLAGLSILSIAIIVERVIFYWRHRVDAETLRTKLDDLLKQSDYQGAVNLLQPQDSLESNIVLAGLREYHRGADAVEDLLAGAEANERLRYTNHLSILGTIGSNAPFIGLFGTVLGIINAFGELAKDLGTAGPSVMAGISEALVATAVGLLVAIPALVAYNAFTTKLKKRAGRAALLGKALLSHLKALPVDGSIMSSANAGKSIATGASR